MINNSEHRNDKNKLVNVKQLNINSDKRNSDKYNSLNMPGDLESPRYVHKSD